VLFAETRQANDPQIFTVLRTDLVAKKGIYPLKYRARYEYYSSNSVESEKFTITVTDRCDEQAIVTASAVTNQAYTITDTLKKYVVPAFTITPTWCAIVYTFDVTNASGTSVISFNSDPLVREFTIHYDADLLLCGATSTNYSVRVKGTVGNIVVRSDSATFTLTLKNPCIDPAFVQINQVALPVGKQYYLHDFKAVGGYKFTHNAFEFVTSPISHSLCGGLTYTATFNGQAINTLTKPPMAYNTATRTFEIYSEDFSLLGDRTITLAAFLTNYPITKSPLPDAPTTIKLLNPCLNPFSLTSNAQINPANYIYKSVARPTVIFTLVPYSVDPDASVCPITYSCAVAGPRTDICSKADGDTVATFNTATGGYTFTSYDMANYPPGAYTFTITGTVGAKSATSTFVMTLVDPCPTTTLTIHNPASFIDQNYVLRDPKIERTWDLAAIVTRETPVNCGALKLEFTDLNTQTLPDADIF